MASSTHIQEAVDALKAGSPIVFPTDTVVGLGVAVSYAPSPAVLAHIKGRSEHKPVAWLVASAEALNTYGHDAPAYAYDLVREQWPGALTLIVKASDAVPPSYQSSQGTIGLRMPAGSVVQELIQRVGCPLATTSANETGQPAPQSVAEVSPRIACAVPYVVRSQTQGSGQASAVIDCTGTDPVVLREGSAQ